MIADGVRTGYLEVLQLTRGNRRTRLPERPWAPARPKGHAGDWAAELRAISEQPGGSRQVGIVDGPSEDGPALTLDGLRDAIAQARADAVAAARVH